MTPSLPMEMIQRVFRELRPDTIQKNIATALILSAISHHWRAVALSTPSLWSTFSFRLRAHHVSDFLPAFLERSLPHRLDITIVFDYREEDKPALFKVQGALALLRRQADRVERLHLKGVPGQRNTVDIDADLWDGLVQAHTLQELVIDGVLPENAQRIISLPHLHTLSLRISQPCGDVIADAAQAALFIARLDVPRLESLIIPELNPAVATVLKFSHTNCSIPSVTRFTILSSGSHWPSLCEYPFFFPGVKDLVLLGNDPALGSVISLASGHPSHWPNLRIIGLTKLEPPPPEQLDAFFEGFCEYVDLRLMLGGHRSRVTVRLPQGVIPQELPPNVAEFVDLTAA